MTTVVKLPVPPRKETAQAPLLGGRLRKVGIPPFSLASDPPPPKQSNSVRLPQKPATTAPGGRALSATGAARRLTPPSTRPERSRDRRPTTATSRAVAPYLTESMCPFCLEAVSAAHFSAHLERCGLCPPALHSHSSRAQDLSTNPALRSATVVDGGKRCRCVRLSRTTSVKPTALVRFDDCCSPDECDELDGGMHLYVSCAVCLQPAPIAVQQRSLLNGKLFGPKRIHFLAHCDHGVCTLCLAMQLDAWHAGQDSCAVSPAFNMEMKMELLDRSAPYRLPRKEPAACPVSGCRAHLSLLDFRQLFPTAVVDRSLERLFGEYVEMQLQNPRSGYTRCPSCRAVVQRIVEVDDEALTMTPDKHSGLIKEHACDAEEHFERWRLRCGHCAKSFCAACLETPYHAGFTCEEHQQNASTKQCRFCERLAAPVQQRGFFASLFSKPRAADCCNQEECLRKAERVCHKVLSCGHGCCGMAGEDECLPCLHPGCQSNSTSHAAEEYCAICYVDELKAQPCIQLGCGHVFHEQCVRDKLDRRWPGARITFSYLNCPICSEPIRHTVLGNRLKDHHQFRDIVRSKMLMRLEHEGMLRVEAVSNEASEFFNNPQKYAEAVLCYYPCCKCGKPYFGGFKQCEAAAMDDDEEGPFNKNELVCPACIPNPDLRVCRLHGADYVEYKCKFCCSIAQWYCWGNTHFCTSCHRRQEMGDYLTKKRKEDLARCEGKHRCPLGVDHPPNGTEFALGCALCRRSQTDQF